MIDFSIPIKLTTENSAYKLVAVGTLGTSSRTTTMYFDDKYDAMNNAMEILGSELDQDGDSSWMVWSSPQCVSPEGGIIVLDSVTVIVSTKAKTIFTAGYYR